MNFFLYHASVLCFYIFVCMSVSWHSWMWCGTLDLHTVSCLVNQSQPLSCCQVLSRDLLCFCYYHCSLPVCDPMTCDLWPPLHAVLFILDAQGLGQNSGQCTALCRRVLTANVFLKLVMLEVFPLWIQSIAMCLHALCMMLSVASTSKLPQTAQGCMHVFEDMKILHAYLRYASGDFLLQSLFLINVEFEFIWKWNCLSEIFLTTQSVQNVGKFWLETIFQDLYPISSEEWAC